MNDDISTAPTSIAPWLSVRNGAEAVEFYKAAFGAVERFRIESGTGDVVARLAVDGAEFWLSDESPEHGNFSPATLGGSRCRMVMIAADPDASFDRAVAAGAAVVSGCRGAAQVAGWPGCRSIWPSLGNREARRSREVMLTIALEVRSAPGRR
jgi:PhnB protein